jgi:hypothetical protein
VSITTPITDGDASAAVVYRLTDADGRLWRSSPYLLANCLYWEYPPGESTVYHSILRIPMLRHLMAGTVAEIEIYVGQVDLQLLSVYPNDPTVDYLDIYPGGGTGGTWGKLKDAVAAAGVGETLYTTGGALENMPPPDARAVCVWRNRAFAANGTNVYPSQEFATGMGIAWNEITHIEWSEGTGDILGMCAIDWNYLALFKRDAVAIISGPGPDGMGSGNYVVQTLSTKAGCTNVRSLVNGADGCYYQDSQTGRLMLLAPTLQTSECAPGAFDLSAYQVSCAIHVEALRQVWFMIPGLPTYGSTVIVLDYKHRTQAAPFGTVYTWELTGLGNVVGAVIVHGVPVLLYSGGDTGEVTPGQAYDIDKASAKKTVLMSLRTGDMNPLGPQRQFNLSRVQFLGEYLDQHTLALITYPNFATSGTSVSATMTAAPEQVVTRPPGCMRIQAISLQVDEGYTSTTGQNPVPIYGLGFKFVGFALEIQDCGKVVSLNVGRVI